MTAESSSPNPSKGPAAPKRARPTSDARPSSDAPIVEMQIRRARGRENAPDVRLPPLNNKSAKMHKLARLLQDHAEGLSITHMSSLLGVDERTVKRYLSDLRRLKFELVQDRTGSGRKSMYRIRSAGSPPGHFLPALRKIRTELHAGGNPKYTALISQVIRFMEDRENAKREVAEEFPANAEAYYIDHGPFAEADPPPGILKILEASIAGRNPIRITYSGYAPESSEFLFHPYSLCLRVGTLYLIGRQGENKGQFKSLSVKRIRRCIGTRDVFVRDAFDPADYYKYCFGQWPRQLNEDPETVLLSLRAPWLEKYLSESHFNPPGRILRRGKEMLFEVKIVIKPDFVNWVLSLSPDLVPVKPEGLRKTAQERLRQGLERLQE